MTPLFINEIYLILPEIIILVAACLALLGDLFFKNRFPAIAFFTAVSGLIIAAIFSYLYFGHHSLIIFNGLIINDDIAHLMKLFIYIAVFLSFVYSYYYVEERNMSPGDYYVLGLFSTLGMMTLVSAHSLLTVYLGLELLSLPLYAMTAIRRSNNDGTEAAMKYFVMGSIASGMLLYGISLIYATTGQIDLAAVAKAIGNEPTPFIAFALVFILAGVGFKIAAVPFHMWVPDVYQGAPSSATLFIGTAPKIAALGMALRILMIAMPNVAPQWQQIILIMALLSAGLGNIVAIAQSNIKRMLAYSAISHLGYALFGILAATDSGFAASLYYVLVYAIMSTAAFGLIVMLSRAGIEIDEIDDLKGLNKRNPWLAFLMMLIMLSMAGIPPLVGFFAKLLVLKALVDANMTWVAVIGLIFAVMGAFYYLRIIKTMYFDEANNVTPIRLAKPMEIIFSINCLALLFLGIFPGALISACIQAVS